MYFYAFLILALIFFIIDWYFYRAVKIYTIRKSEKFKKTIKYTYWGFSALSIAFLFYASYHNDFMNRYVQDKFNRKHEKLHDAY